MDDAGQISEHNASTAGNPPMKNTLTKRRRDPGDTTQSGYEPGSQQLGSVGATSVHVRQEEPVDSEGSADYSASDAGLLAGEIDEEPDATAAAGYSELQAAFEKAYERLLGDPSPSVVDTVLSSRWNPRARRSAALRTRYQDAKSKFNSWDTRSPAWEKKTAYDSLSDAHCRRIVEVPGFKQMLMRTRPDSEYLLAHRIMDEEQLKVGLKKNKKKRLGKGKKSKNEKWQDTVERLVKGREGAAANADGAEQGEEGGGEGGARTRISATGGGGEGGDGEDGGEGGEHLGVIEETSKETMGEGGGAGGARAGADPVEEMKRAWGVGASGINSRFNSLNSVLMSDEHRPQAFNELKMQLEKLWSELKVPSGDVAHVQRFCFGEPSATNLAHLFYQVSCWTQYELQVVNTADLIYQREVLLMDLKDHLVLAGDQVDGPASVKLADFYAFSHEAIAHVGNCTKMYPGNSGGGALLQDYTPKVRSDIVFVDKAINGGASNTRPPPHPEESGPYGGAPPEADLSQHKVRLAAELVLESVTREAAAYSKIVSKKSAKGPR